MGKEPLGKRSEMPLAVSRLFSEDDFSGIHPVRAGHLASLALAAQAYPAVKGGVVIRTEPLGVGTRLLGAGEGRIHFEYGAVCHTDGASDAMLKIKRHCTPPYTPLRPPPPWQWPYRGHTGISSPPKTPGRSRIRTDFPSPCRAA